MNIQPLADNVVVQRFKAEDRTPGGVLLPGVAKEKSQRGKVVCVGDGIVLENGTVRKLQVKKGDEILFISRAGTEVKIDGKEYLFMRERDIIAVIGE